MKKMKLSVKLISAFLAVSVIALVVGYIGTVKIRVIDQADSRMFESNFKPLMELGGISSRFQTMRGAIKDCFIQKFLFAKDPQETIKRIKDLDRQNDEAMARFIAPVTSEEVRREFETMKSSIATLISLRDKTLDLILQGNKEEALRILAVDGANIAKQIESIMSKLTERMIAEAQALSDQNDAVADGAVLFMWIAAGAGTLFAILLGVCLTLSITKPIQRVVEGLSEASDQVAAASSQVSAASQHLAEGSSEQAASLEETSSSLEEMSSMTKQNAGHAGEARKLMQEAGAVVHKVNSHMEEMAQAISEITRSSEQTGKIIKSIDEIAFQTNLLALNAAVEAARAGEAGAGFAVVADEVRNLAMRAAEAARNTSELIQETIKAVRSGNQLTHLTQEAFKENVKVSTHVAQLVDEIATASEEQAQGISQINTAVAEMDRVVQQAAANAEESAGASEEMNAQAEQMRSYVRDLGAIIGGGAHTGTRRSGSKTGRKTPPGKTPKGGVEKIVAFTHTNGNAFHKAVTHLASASGKMPTDRMISLDEPGDESKKRPRGWTEF